MWRPLEKQAKENISKKEITFHKRGKIIKKNEIFLL